MIIMSKRKYNYKHGISDAQRIARMKNFEIFRLKSMLSNLEILDSVNHLDAQDIDDAIKSIKCLISNRKIK